MLLLFSCGTHIIILTRTDTASQILLTLVSYTDTMLQDPRGADIRRWFTRSLTLSLTLSLTRLLTYTLLTESPALLNSKLFQDTAF